MKRQELETILINHIKWINNEKGGGRANLRGADLWGADLRRADLGGADLRGALSIMSFGPVGKERRIGYVVKHEECIMVKLGCFWEPELDAVKAIKAKYGESSNYQLLVYAACREVERGGVNV